MELKINDKWFPFNGYVDPVNSAIKFGEECYKQGRADERAKVIKKIRTELHPCKDCEIKCEEHVILSICVSDKTITYLDLWNLLELHEKE